ncbi:MAG: hypothetical protein FWB99_04230 [Treponema sp.]|nr:hypothetical protein [Treponema sp.]
MSRRFSSHLFWGSHTPLAALTGAGLIIMASSRFSFAILCAAALLWVYGFTALVFSAARTIMPTRGRKIILLFLSAFFCGIFMFITGFLNPLLILGTGFFLFLVPPCCLSSGFFEAAESSSVGEVIPRALLEASVLSGIILAIALIREPLGMGTLSFPGGIQGVVELFDVRQDTHFIPIRFLSASAGGLVLLGYGTAMFRYFRDRGGNTPQNEAAEGER